MTAHAPDPDVKICLQILHARPLSARDIALFQKQRGAISKNRPRGGVTGAEPVVTSSGRDVALMQRTPGGLGRTLGRTASCSTICRRWA